MADSLTSPRARTARRERHERNDAATRLAERQPAQESGDPSELAILRERLRVAATLSARLAAAHEVQDMAELVVDELHESLAFYLAVVQRREGEALRLVAASGPLAELGSGFLLREQSVTEGVNGRVARTGASALVADTRKDADYVVRDPRTDPRSELSVPVVVDGQLWGVLNIEAAAPHSFDEADLVLVESVAASLGSAIHRAHLVADLERTFTTTLTTLMSTIEMKDGYTASHEESVAGLAERVALRAGLSRSQAREVRYAALLHDVGKVAVPSEILLKPGPLSEEEWVVMRSHAAAGGALVARIDAFAHLSEAVRGSHERWDGGGYPDGLAGRQIPLAARIIAVCDTYDAIVSDRPYRPGRPPREAAVELRRVSGSQLDLQIVEILLEELAL